MTNTEKVVFNLWKLELSTEDADALLQFLWYTWYELLFNGDWTPQTEIISVLTDEVPDYLNWKKDKIWLWIVDINKTPWKETEIYIHKTEKQTPWEFIRWIIEKELLEKIALEIAEEKTKIDTKNIIETHKNTVLNKIIYKK